MKNKSWDALPLGCFSSLPNLPALAGSGSVVLSLLTLFFVEAGTLEFKVTAVSAAISFLTSAVCIWIMIRDEKKL